MKSILKSSSIISIMTLISRIVGFVRDAIIARLFGVSPALDAFIVAFKIPNFFRRLFAEGAFSQSVMPILATSQQEKNEQEVINHIAGRLFTILLITTIIGVIASPVIIFAFAWGFYFDNAQQFYLASDLLKITFPYLLLISLTAFFGSILNSHQQFLIPAITPVLLNVAIILSSIFLGDYFTNPIFSLAWGVLIGGVLQLLLQIPFLIKIGKLPKFKNKKHPVLKTLKERMLPAIFGLSVSQINLLIDTMIASTLVAGSISWLYYANRLLELPLALVGVALGVVSIAKLSKYFANNDNENFKKTIDESFKLAIIFAVPASFGLVILAKPLIITLFAYGNFAIVDSTNSALALSAYGLGLVFFILIKIIAPIFLARGDTKTPVIAGIFAMVTNIVLNIILAYFYGFVGIAIATSISALINFGILLFFSYHKNIYKINKNLLLLTIKVLVSSIIMAIFLIIFKFDYISLSVYDRILSLAITIILSLVIYFVTLMFFRVKLR